MTSELHRYPDPKQAAEACGASILEMLERAVTTNGRAALAVSGGSSPKLMFDSMARTKFNWDAVHLFWVDERSVPPDHEQSNFRMARAHLIEPARIRNVHRIQAEMPPDHAASLYADDTRAYFGPAVTPVFDVIHLGIGPDSHTASLFPNEPLIEDRQGIAAAVYVAKIPQWRITLLPAVLLSARDIVVLATGADKKAALEHVLHTPYSPNDCPAQILRKRDKAAMFYVDQP